VLVRLPLSTGTPQQGFDPTLGEPPAPVGTGCHDQHCQRLPAGKVGCRMRPERPGSTHAVVTAACSPAAPATRSSSDAPGLVVNERATASRAMQIVSRSLIPANHVIRKGYGYLPRPGELVEHV
jgi:hypothetical protein